MQIIASAVMAGVFYVKKYFWHKLSKSRCFYYFYDWRMNHM
ncbi:hypothetical protein P869_08885 [Ligilactobacillus ruminis S23]|nr:hypothetical protein P869_08885 [Ligilactobacillus ruminis S23]